MRAMREILRDVHQGARLLAKNPGFTATALCTLVIGIGASAEAGIGPFKLGVVPRFREAFTNSSEPALP